MIKKSTYIAEKQTVFTKYAPIKNINEHTWYGVIDVKSGSLLVEKTTRFKIEAVNYFEKVAKQNNGVLNTVQVYK